MKFYFPLLSWVAISVAFSFYSCTAQPPFQLSGQIELDPAYKPIAYLKNIGYSIDNDGEAWKKAIANDQATWVRASHLVGDSTPFMDALRISTIPANFILDARGKVVAKNVYGEALQNFVMEYLK